jgi:ABC-type Zn uptake system ZnuABC Zn-binding protein ZnuA
VLVSPGSNPHAFEPSPSQIKSINRAGLMVLIGPGLEFWKDKVIAAADNPDLKVLELAEGMDLISDSSHGSREHVTGGNPHIWLSPRSAVIIVQKIRDALVMRDPAGRACYLERAEKYTTNLNALDRDTRQRVAGWSCRKFLAQHSTWVYFARDYGLEQVGALESTPGREPSPAEIRDLIQNASRAGAKAIFAERQFSPKGVEVLAAECGCPVIFLDTLGTPPAYNYIELMKKNVDEMERALK